MDITINNDFGKIYKFEVNKNDRILDIKVKIQSWSTIPTDRQHLFYHDQELEDEKTIKEYKIKNDETLFNKISSISKEDNQNLQQHESEQALHPPKAGQNQHHSDSQNEDEKEDSSKISITIKDYDGNFSTYLVSKTDTFSMLKKRIQHQINVFPDHMQLKGSYIFRDNDFISDFLKEGEVINLFTKNDQNKIINVNFVNMNKEQQFSLKFIPKYEIQQVINKIALILNTEPYQIDLFYENTSLNPTTTLFDYSINNGSTIKFKKIDDSSNESYQIKIVTPYEGAFTMDVLSSYKIDDLISKILEQRFFPTPNIRLVIEGRFIYQSDDDDTIRKLGIKEGTVLNVQY